MVPKIIIISIFNSTIDGSINYNSANTTLTNRDWFSTLTIMLRIAFAWTLVELYIFN